MSQLSAPSDQHDGGKRLPIYRFGENSFYIWNDDIHGFTEVNGNQWQFDYSYLPQLPRANSLQVLKDNANLSDAKTPTSVSLNTSQAFMCTAISSQAPTASFDAADSGLRIDNVNTTLEETIQWHHPIPQITTEPATRNNTVDEVPQTLFTKPTTRPYDITPPQPGYLPDLGNDATKSTTLTQDSFQLQSPVTRRNSMSSCTSGPVFSHYGTPNSTYPYESVGGTPYSRQSSSQARLPQFSPRSPAATWKPQSRKQSTGSWSRMNQEYYIALQRTHGPAGISMTVPTRRKPRIDRGLSDSSLFKAPTHPTAEVKHSEGRRRAASAVGQSSTGETSSVTSTNLLHLPVFQPDKMFASPICTQASFPTTESARYSPSLQPSYPSQPVGNAYMTPESQHQISLTPPPAFDPYLRPAEPPASDFQYRAQAQMPVFQAPQFDGDIYTPQYKRRNAKGEWEGWCGLCHPGQWHNLKNSRYWDDKLRNHGICARTKRRFDDPLSLRVVNLDGDVIDVDQDTSSRTRDIRADEWVVSGLDGSLRKREGLCGWCMEWISMDGARSRAKGKSVGWWTHAYKCHEQARKASSTVYYDNDGQTHSQYQAHAVEQFQQPHHPDQPVYISHVTDPAFQNYYPSSTRTTNTTDAISASCTYYEEPHDDQRNR